MPTTLSRCNAALQGLLLGVNGGYLVSVVLGLFVPSWPFNAFFTSAAVIALLLQGLQYVFLTSAQVPYYQTWAGSGALVMLGLWLFYFFG